MTIHRGCLKCGAAQVEREIIVRHECGFEIAVTSKVEAWQLPGEPFGVNGSYEYRFGPKVDPDAERYTSLREVAKQCDRLMAPDFHGDAREGR